ncbi:MAG TPA: SDR family oxidoreductase [Gemmataceae bacterium]|nr:SDR family oxidoreductase [Gemmataceae bacterium]
MDRTGAKGLVVVTGASGGIGYELAKLFARDGWPLLLAARSGDKLTTFASELTAAHNVPVAVCAVDLAKPDSPTQLCEAAKRQDRPIGVLVNNAGFGRYGPFVRADLDDALQILQVNIVALTQLTRLVLPEMVQRNEGRIMNVASTAAFQAGPLMAVYYASKAYVLHFSEALDAELRKTKVGVSAFCPGPTATGFEARAGMGESKLFTGRHVISAAAAAAVGYRGLMQGQRVVIPGLWNNLLVQSNRIFPRRWITRVVQWMQRRRKAE